jgi:hypothetical protein
MIEVPSEFLNALFMLLVVVSSIKRSRRQSTGDKAFGL